MHRFALVSNIGASTRIENATLTDPEVLWVDSTLCDTAFQEEQTIIEDKLSKDRERSIEEVAGCRSLLLLIYSQASDFFPFSETYLRGFHQELMQFFPAAKHFLGKYKSVPNSVIERNTKTGEERIVFKTADAGPVTEAAMRDLVAWYNHELLENPWSVAVACEFVFRFLAIHPFQDGNGRLGRALFLMTLLQSSDEALAQLAPFMAIDRQIERHRQEYYSVLQRCSGGVFQQDPRSYQMEYFLNYMIKMLNLALADIDLYRERFSYLQQLSESALKVLNCFRDFPEKRLQTKEVVQATALPRRTVVYAINQLLEHSFIRKRGRGAGVRYQVVF